MVNEASFAWPSLAPLFAAAEGGTDVNEQFFSGLWEAAKLAGPFGTLLGFVWGYLQYKRAEQERAERIELQKLLIGPGGLTERVVKGLNDTATSVTAIGDAVRPIINAVVAKVGQQ